MYGLPHAVLIAQQLLKKRLNKQSYKQSPLTPGLWTHAWRPITFSLCVDDFGIKYVGERHARHLRKILQEHYEILEDWEGTMFAGIDLKWYYIK